MSQPSIFGDQENTSLSSLKREIEINLKKERNRNRVHLEKLNFSKSFRISIETEQYGRKAMNPDRLGVNIEVYHFRLCDLKQVT